VELTFLGTGTSHGIPVIGCQCSVCTSSNPKNKRTRSSVILEVQGLNILIDTATEFRLQALAAQIERVDAVLYTHCHADHVFGFDDLRVFGYHQQQAVPVYGNEPTITELRSVFAYAFRKTQEGGGKPQVETNIVAGQFQIQGVEITPIPVFHGELPIFGYRIGRAAYVTDCSCIPPQSLTLLKDLDLLILGVIRREPHPTHMHLDQALELVETLRPKRTYFTHISHLLDHDETNHTLPQGVELAYDGLRITVD
jgi:phosphoribosyl 1,2-cyclic phosphate phosphodiesterase